MCVQQFPASFEILFHRFPPGFIFKDPFLLVINLQSSVINFHKQWFSCSANEIWISGGRDHALWRREHALWRRGHRVLHDYEGGEDGEEKDVEPQVQVEILPGGRNIGKHKKCTYVSFSLFLSLSLSLYLYLSLSLSLSFSLSLSLPLSLLPHIKVAIKYFKKYFMRLS